jgi:hypothetical protein
LLSWFRPPPTMRWNGLVPEMARSTGHRSALMIELGSILLLWMGKVVTNAVLSQAVRCTKCSGLDGAILSSAGYPPWEFFLSPESRRTLCTCSLHELSRWGRSGSWHRNLWIGSYKLTWWSSGVGVINCPSLDNGVSYARCEVDVLDSDPQGDKFLNLDSGGDPAT